MKKKYLAIVIISAFVVATLSMALLKRSLSADWPDDPGPLEAPRPIAYDPEATAVFEALLAYEDLGLTAERAAEVSDLAAELVRAPMPARGSATPTDTAEVVLDANDAVMDGWPHGPGEGVWDAVAPALETYLSLAEHGPPERQIAFDEAIDLSGLMTLNHILRLRARAAWIRGDSAWAVNDLHRGLVVAARLSDSGTSLVVTMLGASHERALLGDVAAIARDLQPGERQLLQATLQVRREARPTIANALVYEAHALHDAITEVEVAAEAEFSEGIQRVPLVQPYDRERTHIAMRAGYSQWISVAEQPPSERVWPTPVDMTSRRGWQLDNPVGRVLVSMPPSWESMVTYFDDVSAHRDMAFLALAITDYESRHGRLPETVDALVPELLDALPEDPFDFRPSATPGYAYDPTSRTLRGDLITDDGPVIAGF